MLRARQICLNHCGFFCGGHSFRGSKDSEVINWDKNFAKIEMRFLGQEREQTAKILFKGGKKTVEINGVQKIPQQH